MQGVLERKAFLLGICGLVLFLLLYGAAYSLDFDERSNKKIGKVTSDCELNRAGAVRQPVNAVTGLALSIPALVILWRWQDLPDSSSADYPGRETSPYAEQSLETALFIIAVFGVAYGTALAHGTKMRIGSQSDTIGMAVWILIPATWAVMRALGRGRLFHLVTWASLSATTSWWMIDTKGYGITDLYFTIIPIWVMAELIAHFRGIGSINRWSIAAAALFGLAYQVRSLGVKSSSTCDPESLFQWHAAWHTICIFVIWCWWRHLASVPPVAQASSEGG